MCDSRLQLVCVPVEQRQGDQHADLFEGFGPQQRLGLLQVFGCRRHIRRQDSGVGNLALERTLPIAVGRGCTLCQHVDRLVIGVKTVRYVADGALYVADALVDLGARPFGTRGLLLVEQCNGFP